MKKSSKELRFLWEGTASNEEFYGVFEYGDEILLCSCGGEQWSCYVRRYIETGPATEDLVNSLRRTQERELYEADVRGVLPQIPPELLEKVKQNIALQSL